jgi:putative acetyltransferase
MSNSTKATIENLDITNLSHANVDEPLVIIRPESPLHPKLGALWAAKVALSRSLYPAESDYSYGVEQLAAAHVLFLVAELGDEFVGCGAAANHGDYGELKSMFVLESMRGRRIGEQLIVRLEAHMQQQGLPIARLETGIDSHSALRLYARMGYQRCGPFGDYPADPLCVFMEKHL